jgi:hypothetical protein
MISVKSSLAFLISIVLAIIAYFISSADFSSSISMLLPSIFIILTTASLLTVSRLQSGARTAPKKTKRAASPVKTTSGDITTLYVGNLAYKANEETVQEYFEKVGKVKSVRLVKDKRTGRRKGFGFIEINSGDVNQFIDKLNESEFMERSIIVRPANEKQH